MPLFLKLLRKHSQRQLPQEPMACEATTLDLQGCTVGDQEAAALGQLLPLSSLNITPHVEFASPDGLVYNW